jgi:cellobiose transport system permease protein
VADTSTSPPPVSDEPAGGPGGGSTRTATATPSRAGPRARRRGRARSRVVPYFYIAPFFLVFGIFGLFPLVYTIWVSLRDWSILGGDGGWVGLANYQRMLSDDRFWNALLNTFSIWIISTVPQLILALILASVLNHQLLRWKTGFRMAVLVPNITSVVAVGIIFTQIFGRDFGFVNQIVTGLGFEPILWQVDRLPSHVAISLMVMWRWTGYNALIYLAAMTTIPKTLYESASIDGAGTLRKFFSITIPQLRPTIIFTVIISTIGGMQIFAEPLIFGGQNGVQGGSNRQFQTVTLFLYEQGFRDGNFGYAAAVAWALFLIIAAVAYINFRLSRTISSE